MAKKRQDGGDVNKKPILLNNYVMCEKGQNIYGLEIGAFPNK